MLVLETTTGHLCSLHIWSLTLLKIIVCNTIWVFKSIKLQTSIWYHVICLIGLTSLWSNSTEPFRSVHCSLMSWSIQKSTISPFFETTRWCSVKIMILCCTGMRGRYLELVRIEKIRNLIYKQVCFVGQNTIGGYFPQAKHFSRWPTKQLWMVKRETTSVQFKPPSSPYLELSLLHLCLPRVRELSASKSSVPFALAIATFPKKP